MTRSEALAVLGLTPLADKAEIKAAYRDLALVWHPDRFGSDVRLRAKAEAQLKQINTAYAALKDDEFEAEREVATPAPAPPAERQINWSLAAVPAAIAAVIGIGFLANSGSASAGDTGSQEISASGAAMEVGRSQLGYALPHDSERRRPTSSVVRTPQAIQADTEPERLATVDEDPWQDEDPLDYILPPEDDFLPEDEDIPEEEPDVEPPFVLPGDDTAILPDDFEGV